MCSFFSPVSAVEDQSEPEVGGCVEGTGLSGSRSLLCGPGGKRTFAQVLPVGAFPPELHPHFSGQTKPELDAVLLSQHSMVIDTRNSSILPSGGGLMKIHQVGALAQSQTLSQAGRHSQLLLCCRNWLDSPEETLVS